MGKLIEGKWLNDAQLAAFEQQQYQAANGHFQRGTAQFRNWITADGSVGISGEGGFKAEAGRYHLFAALNCPWAHRTLIYRSVKKLENVISLSLVKPLRTDNGWVFDDKNKSDDSRFTETLLGLSALHQLYVKSAPDYSGRVTVPVLWDKQQNKIVSTESAEIIRMFNSAFNEITGDQQDFYPEALTEEIDALNDYIYQNINNGVYQTGFARTQAAYSDSVVKVFAALDTLEQRLANSKYLLGNNVTEADWRLLPTLVRFDVGYFTAFKCNLRALRDYPNLSQYLQDIINLPNVAKTIELDVYRKGYNSVSPLRNPHGIVPIGFTPAFSY
ncbi:glutathione-dependent reductase [Colwellia sp. 39_35_sub15_T18]|nr:glutathione-dependent reductase [Colwellia sp. 39_35_sub15_T18]